MSNIPLENGMVVRKDETRGWYTTLGDTIITKPTDNYNGQLEQIDDINYHVLINIIIHVVRAITKNDKIKIKQVLNLHREDSIGDEEATDIITGKNTL